MKKMNKKIFLNSVSVFENEDGTEDFVNFKDVQDFDIFEDVLNRGPARIYTVQINNDVTLKFYHYLNNNTICFHDSFSVPVKTKQINSKIIPIFQYTKDNHISAI